MLTDSKVTDNLWNKRIKKGEMVLNRLRLYQILGF